MDFNLETYTQQIDVTAGASSVLTYTDFSGNQGSIAVPAGAVTQTVGLAYTPLVAPSNTLPYNQAAALTFRLTGLVAGVPQSTFVFSQPVTLTVPYGLPDVAGIGDVNSLNLDYWDGAAWQDAASTCETNPYKHLDTAAQVMQVRICHLSEFSLMGTTKHWVYLPLMRR
jgi:peptide/nickel transport system substrate-binding protein